MPRSKSKKNISATPTETFNTKQINQYLKSQMSKPIKVCCPKCGSSDVEKLRNQEFHCKTCGETFYFVTPNTGSASDMERYEL